MNNKEELIKQLEEILKKLDLWAYDGSGYIPVSNVQQNKQGMLILGNDRLIAPEEV